MAASLLRMPAFRCQMIIWTIFVAFGVQIVTSQNDTVTPTKKPLTQCRSTRDSNDGQIAEMEYQCPTAEDPDDHTECCGSYGMAQCCAINNDDEENSSFPKIRIHHKDGIIIAVIVVTIVTVITSILIICICWVKCPLYKYNCLRFNTHGEPLSFSVSKSSEGNVAMKSVSKLPETPDRGQYKPLATDGEDADESKQNVTTVSELDTTNVAYNDKKESEVKEEKQEDDVELETVENPRASLQESPRTPVEEKGTEESATNENENTVNA